MRGLRTRRARVARALALAAGAAALGAPAAEAALPLTDCGRELPGARCASLTVPLSHLGSAPGTVELELAVLPARGENQGTVALLPGGPGQAAIPLGPVVRDALAPILENHDVLLVDPRGTGGSDAVTCRPPTSPARVAACARALGPRRPFYTTFEQAADLEAVRTALELGPIVPFGISYGTKVAAEYVRRYPASTARAVLDSPTPVDGLDTDFRLRSLALPRVLREVCFPPGCPFLGEDPVAAFGTLARRLARRPLRAAAVLPSGRRVRGMISDVALYALVVTSDEDPLLRAELPAAVASGLRGDGAPLARLLTQLAPTGAAASGFQDEDEAGVNDARFLATTCVEGRFPWAPDSPLAGRAAALRRALRAAPDAFAPFSPATVLPLAISPDCLAWPPTPAPVPVDRLATPDVPVLVIAGRDDLRTPLEDARRTAAEYPGARLLSVPHAGHAVVLGDLSGCAVERLGAFLAGAQVEDCEPSRRPLGDLAPFVPERLADLRPAPGAAGRPGRTATAALATVRDAQRQAVRALLTGRRTARFGGLRAGTATIARSGGPSPRLLSLTLRGYSVVAGVTVAGRLTARGATVTVSGPAAAAGTLRLGARITGTLGGRRVRLTR